MATIDKKYHELVNTIINNGYWYDDPYRKGVKRKEIATYEFKYNLQEGFPALTTKKLYWKGVVGELIWFLRGDTSIKYLIKNNIHIWDKDAYNFYVKNKAENENPYEFESWLKEVLKDDGSDHDGYISGDLGRVYGAQWRNFNGVDQISKLVKGMKERPLATDLLVTAWNPSELTKMALPPCHYGFQVIGRPLSLEERFNTIAGKGIPIGFKNTEDLDEIGVPKYGFTLIWQQRSVDTFLGLPFNVASYALLAHILGTITNMVPLELIGSLRNVHIYDNAIDTIREQLDRDVNLNEDP